MNITREIVTDLLPLYLAGEASPDSKTLIEEYFVQDPDFARMVNIESNTVLQEDRPGLLQEDLEMITLKKTRVLLRKRTATMALGISFFLWTAAFRFDPGGLTWLWSDTPFVAAILILAGLASWAFYFQTIQRLEESGL